MTTATTAPYPRWRHLDVQPLEDGLARIRAALVLAWPTDDGLTVDQRLASIRALLRPVAQALRSVVAEEDDARCA